MVIQVGDSTAAVKQEISDLLEYVTGDGEITSWLNATNRINEVADILGRDSIADGMAGATARARINALWDGPVWAPGSDLAMDFREGLYYRGAVTDTHATDILALGSGGYETFGPDELVRTDLGLLTTVGRTNKCTNYNAAPTDLTGVTKAGDAAATLTVVDDLAALEASGLFTVLLSEGKMNGNVYKLDNSAGTANANVTLVGATGNTNTHATSAYMRGSGSANVRLFTTSPTGFVLSSDYQRYVNVAAPSSSNSMTVQAEPGAVVYFILNQLEEGPFATDPIITEGSAVTRPGNMPVIDLTGRLSEGVSGVYQMDWLGVASFMRHLFFSDGSFDNALSIGVGSTGGVRWEGWSGGSSQGTGGQADTPIATGMMTVAIGVSDGFRALRVVGDAQRNDHGKPLPSGMNAIGVGGLGFSTNNNTYAQFKRLALKFGPQDQTSFDAMYALAQEWAAE